MKGILVAAGDLHLSHTSPAIRSQEPDWYAAMGRVVDELVSICEEYSCPLVLPGDIFDRWNSTAELINWAIEKFSRFPRGVYTVAGQHDLPYHGFSAVRRSAYWTLVKAGVVKHLSSKEPEVLTSTGVSVGLFGYSWGESGRIFEEEINRKCCDLAVAVMHEFVWVEGKGYPGCEDSGLYSNWTSKLKTEGPFCMGIFGDNHKGFTVGDKIDTDRDPVIVNCGTVMIRRTDDLDHHPFVVVLKRDLSLEVRLLDTSKDVYCETLSSLADAEGGCVDVTGLVEELRSLGPDSLDFREMVRTYIRDNNVDQEVARAVVDILESVEG